MHATMTNRHKIALGFTTAMAAVLLSGCAAGSAPRAEVSASSAQTEMARGHHDRAVEHAEAAVRAEPQNAAYRMVLGDAYLDGGRFGSAETAFSDAMTLGDNSPRAALALALSQIAQAKYAPALALLNQYDGQIAAADHGLALALAGQPERGIHMMSNAIRGGENTVKMRQNLAYAYAMAGRWREARLMAQQDVPAGEVGARMEQWASMAPSEAYQHRVAGLLGVPTGVADAGLPAHLALGNNPSVETLMAEAAPQPLPGGELAAVAPMGFAPSYEPAPMAAPELAPELARVDIPASEPGLPAYVSRVPAQDAEFASAFGGAPAPVQQPAPALDARRIAGEPNVQAATPRTVAAARPAAARPTASAPVALASGTHLVQLGSFLSEAGARRAWGIYQNRYPELADREMVITEAVVRGRHYWRVSAGGLSQSASRDVCGRVRSAGNGCITWAEGRPLPGALDRGVRLARR